MENRDAAPDARLKEMCRLLVNERMSLFLWIPIFILAIHAAVTFHETPQYI